VKKKKKVRRLVKILRVDRKRDLCVILEDWDCDNFCVEIRYQETDSEEHVEIDWGDCSRVIVNGVNQEQCYR
jgi:hypothetical protein